MFKNILVAVDGTPTAQRGLKLATDLAADQHATLHIVHVVDANVVLPLEGGFVPADYFQSMKGALRETGRAILDRAAAFAGDRGLQVRSVLVESTGHDVAARLLREAGKRKADLIVLGTHGRRGLRRLLLGSDAEMVLREARVPVLLVRVPARAPARPRAEAPKAARRSAPASGKSVPRLLTGAV
jgi:nucleotide-binding universal stress UspA family protein